ncbi:unnamed protein product, partial [Meganyctiphanes norvegica]
MVQHQLPPCTPGDVHVTMAYLTDGRVTESQETTTLTNYIGDPILGTNIKAENCKLLTLWRSSCPSLHFYCISWSGQHSGSVTTNRTSFTIEDLSPGSYSVCLQPLWNQPQQYNQEEYCVNHNVTECSVAMEVETIGNNYITLTWTKESPWIDINNFTVNITGEGGHVYHCKPFLCNTSHCEFSSQSYCPALKSCTTYNITVTGGPGTATAQVTTAPNQNPDLYLSINKTILSIKWKGPFENCSHTALLTMTFNNDTQHSDITVHPGVDNTVQHQLPSCTPGDVHVTMAYLTDGRATESQGTATFRNYIGDPFLGTNIKNESCALLTLWRSSCPSLHFYCLSWSGQHSGSVTTNRTSFTIENLPSGSYNVCLQPLWNQQKCFNQEEYCVNHNVTECPYVMTKTTKIVIICSSGTICIGIFMFVMFFAFWRYQ